MSHSNAQESALLQYEFGISGTTPPVATHLAMCTADPEDGTGVSTATRIPIGTFTVNGAQQSGRTRVQNSGTRLFTNDTAGSLTVTHLAAMTASTGGAVVASFALGQSRVVAAGSQLNFAADSILFDLG